MEIFTPTNAHKDFFNLIKNIVSDSQPVEISSTKDNTESVIMISKSDWNAIQETLYLQQVGVLDRINHFKDETSEDLREIDWDSL